MSLKVLRCPSCGGNLDVNENDDKIVCPYCGSAIDSLCVKELVSDEVLSPKMTNGTKAFRVLMWCLFVIPGLVLKSKEKKAEYKLMQLKSRIQHDASQIDNYLEQRVIILENLSRLINKEMAYEKDAIETISGYKNGISDLNLAATQINSAEDKLKEVFKEHPELLTNSGIEKAMKDNDYLQREITAAREVYNDSVSTWNSLIFKWPEYVIVASKNNYKTKVPFKTTRDIRSKAREVLF